MIAEPRSVSLSSAELAILRRILAEVIPHAEVRLFGSRATGLARPFSDVDLLVVRPDRLTWHERARLRDRFDECELPFCVDVVEAEALPEGMIDRVFSEAVALPAIPID